MDEQTILESVGKHAGLTFTAIERLHGGDEANVFRLKSAGISYVLHISPSWRSRQELKWAQTVAARAHESINEVVIPIDGNDGTVFELEGRCAVLYPFVAGEIPDRENATHRTEAARLLGEIHKTLIGWAPGQRPPSLPGRPAIPPDADELNDSTLDDWWKTEITKGLVTGVTHGDYYRGNLICRNGKIRGIIDWHDASVRPLAVEVAGAAYEFCRNDDYVINVGRVSEFIKAYRENGGPVPDCEVGMLLNFMRWWVREDARNSFSESPGRDNEYAWKQVRSFAALREISIDL